MHALRLALNGALLAMLSACLPGCSSSDSYNSSRVSTGSSFYYGSPYPYFPGYGYGGPDYIVVAPPRPPYPDGNRPTTLPAERPNKPSTRPANAASSRSRMPPAQPRMSSPSSRPSIPNRSRGGGGRRGR